MTHQEEVTTLRRQLRQSRENAARERLELRAACKRALDRVREAERASTAQALETARWRESSDTYEKLLCAEAKKLERYTSLSAAVGLHDACVAENTRQREELKALRAAADCGGARCQTCSACQNTRLRTAVESAIAAFEQDEREDRAEAVTVRKSDEQMAARFEGSAGRSAYVVRYLRTVLSAATSHNPAFCKPLRSGALVLP